MKKKLIVGIICICIVGIIYSIWYNSRTGTTWNGEKYYIFGDYYCFLENGEATLIRKYKNEDETDVIIPSKIGKYPVVGLGGYTRGFLKTIYGIFEESTIKSVVIPEGITTIERRAFASSDIREVILPKTLREMGDTAFSRCEQLRKVEYNIGIEKVEEFTFSNCKFLTEVYLSESIVTIERSAFSQCRALEEIKLPQSLRRIEERAFSRCESLRRIEIGENTTDIADNAFERCDNLTIYGKAGSYAESYAKEQNIPFEILE